MADVQAYPEGVRVGVERLIQVTEPAAEQIGKLREREQKGDLLRVKITGGGCNGLSYKLRFIATPKAGDIVIESHGERIVVDSKSALYLRGMTLDYSSALVAGGFKFHNPNAKASCSCGESFAV